MSTLPGFHSRNFTLGTDHLWPSQQQRSQVIQQNLHHSRTWDIPNRVPLGPLQATHAGLREGSAHSDPILTEHRSQAVKHLYVPTRPYTERIVGDTADSRLIYTPDQNVSFMTQLKSIFQPSMRTPIRGIHRFAPY